jgi:hypothetical protein
MVNGDCGILLFANLFLESAVTAINFLYSVIFTFVLWNYSRFGELLPFTWHKTSDYITAPLFMN